MIIHFYMYKRGQDVINKQRDLTMNNLLLSYTAYLILHILSFLDAGTISVITRLYIP